MGERTCHGLLFLWEKAGHESTSLATILGKGDGKRAMASRGGQQGAQLQIWRGSLEREMGERGMASLLWWEIARHRPGEDP